MSVVQNPRQARQLPVIAIPQGVPSQVCVACEVCCRFPETDSFLRPYFTAMEIRVAVERGIPASFFPELKGCQIEVVPNPSGEGYLCPAFAPTTSQCRIYDVRPLDCRLYPFVVMWDAEHRAIVLGWDTKCPFLIAQAQETHDADPWCRFGGTDLVLSPELQKIAHAVAARVETPDIMEVIAAHPALVARFQDDVVVIHPLDTLTKRVCESRM